MINNITELPVEMLCHVLNPLPTKDLSKVEQCSTNCKRAVQEIYKDRINVFIRYFSVTEKNSNSCLIRQMVVRKWREIGAKWAKEYEENGKTSSQIIRQLHDLKFLFKDSIHKLGVNLNNLNDNRKLPLILQEMIQSNEIDHETSRIPVSLQYEKELRLFNDKRMKTNLTIEKVAKEFAKIDMYLPIGRDEVEERLNKIAQEGVFTFRPSSQPGMIALSCFDKGKVRHGLITSVDVNDCPTYTSILKIFKDINLTKTLFAAEQELSIIPGENKQKISLTEHQAIHQSLTAEIMTLDYYIQEMNREEAQKFLKAGQCCIRPSSNIDSYGHPFFVLSYKQVDQKMMHHFISIDEYGRLIINEIPYSCVREFFEKGMATGFFKKFYTKQNYQQDKLWNSTPTQGAAHC